MEGVEDKTSSPGGRRSKGWRAGQRDGQISSLLWYDLISTRRRPLKTALCHPSPTHTPQTPAFFPPSAATTRKTSAQSLTLVKPRSKPCATGAIKLSSKCASQRDRYRDADAQDQSASLSGHILFTDDFRLNIARTRFRHLLPVSNELQAPFCIPEACTSLPNN